MTVNKSIVRAGSIINFHKVCTFKGCFKELSQFFALCEFFRDQICEMNVEWNHILYKTEISSNKKMFSNEKYIVLVRFSEFIQITK